MNFLESIKMALTSIKVNKMRSFLTMLGIIIGIGAVITITTIGNSISQTLTKTMGSLGGNQINVWLQPKDMESGEYPEMKDSDQMTLAMIDEFIGEHSDELYVQLNENFGNAELANENNESFSAELCGVTDASFKSTPAIRKQIVKGRELSNQDCELLKHSCVVTDYFCEQYFKDPDGDVIGKTIDVNMENGKIMHFVIVGVMELSSMQRNSYGLNTVTDKLEPVLPLYVPYHTMKYELGGDDPEDIFLNDVYFGFTSKCDADTAKQYITEYFEEAYENNENWYPYIYSSAEELGMINTVLNVVTIAISVIAAISLVVGGVGVMNIMLVSILERTREIGVRKALGALHTDIRRQFVIEAVVICLTGGIIGVLSGLLNGVMISAVASKLINTLAPDYAMYISLTVQPSIMAIVISLAFSMLTGLIFGYYPAKRAANMNPIDALRYE